MGKIIAVQYKNDKSNDDHEDRLLVDFDGKELSYPKKNLNQLSLAYATTVHKAQGNEFKLVIVALTTRFGLMLNRNLLYTGITRAKEALILVGEYEAFSRAAQTAVAYRATFLTERLKDEVVIQQKNSHDKKRERAILKNILTFELIQSDTIEPLIGLNGITPYDFMPN